MAALHRFVLLPVLALGSMAPLEAQIIRGVVVEADTRAPVDGAEVTLVTAGTEPTPRATTDSLGTFVLAAPGAGRYRLRVTHPGYRSSQVDSVEVGASETVSVELRMGLDAIPLEPMVVTARRRSAMAEFEERRAGGFGRFIVREDIERRAASRTTDLLRGVAGLTVVRVRRGRGALVLMRSGLGLCEPTIWIDGNLVDQSEESTLDDFLPPGNIEGVEIYRSAAEAPVQYSRGRPCGVILFWTRPGSREGGDPWDWKKVAAGVGAALGIIILFVH